MPTSQVYNQILRLLNQHLHGLAQATLKRLALLVVGIIGAEDGSPAQVAQALHIMGLSQATAESIERRIRRIENDPEITAALCFHPLAQERLCWGRPQELLLVLDPTTQEDRIVMLTAAVWYRGRALPLAWAIWPGNTPLTDKRFWARVEALLDVVAKLLPAGVTITWLADRAFGTPNFTDLVKNRGWHYVVRVQGGTHCRDKMGREYCIRDLVHLPGQRAKLRGQAFKKQGWRESSMVVFWGRSYQTPLCLVSDLPPRWWLIRLYRRRYVIEATFRDYKSKGWCWEQGQVTKLAHIEHLLVGMALATWVALFVGTQVAEEYLEKAATRMRLTKPWEGKFSLFHLGVLRIKEALSGSQPATFVWRLCDWSAPNWQDQIHTACVHVFLFGVPYAYEIVNILNPQLEPVRL